MQLVINIDDKLYEIIKNPKKLETMYHAGRLCEAVRNGTPLPKGHGALKDADKIEDITWQEPYYHDALNVLSEIRDKIRNQRTIIKADKEERK